MRLHRFYIEEKLAGEKEIKIFDENLLHQMKSVFRLEKGDKVVFFDGSAVPNFQKGVGHLSGRDFECEIKILAKKEGVFEVLTEKPAFIPEKAATLYLSVIKKDNFELASRMATEIGVSKIVPILTERSEKKNLDIERLKRIVKEASEQSGRGNLPEVAPVESLKLKVESLDANTEIFVADFGGAKISDLLSSTSHSQLVTDPARLGSESVSGRHFSLFIGPEGGWSESERELFRSKGAKFISLGDTVLRAETAVAVATSLLLG